MSGTLWIDAWEERRFDYAEGVREAKAYVDHLERGSYLPNRYSSHGELINEPLRLTPEQIAEADAAFERARRRLRKPQRNGTRPFKPQPINPRNRFRCITNPIFSWEEIRSYSTAPDDHGGHAVDVILVLDPPIGGGIKCATCRKDVHIDVDTFKLRHGKSRRRKPPPWRMAA